MLTSLNGLGVSLDWKPETLDDGAVAYLSESGLPLWLLWLSDISDYELLVTVPERNLAAARAAVPSLNPIGRLTESTGATVAVDGRTIPIDLDALPSFGKTAEGSRMERVLGVLSDIQELGLP
jgi:thiamine monophosphate kinase